MMKWKWVSYIGVLFFILVGLQLTGCGLSESANNIVVPSIFAQQDIKKEKVNVDVYWDATYSMQGYTTIASGNAYRNLPDRLEDVGNSMGDTKFFRFGETVQPLEGREHRKFSEASFYNETVTAIHTVIDSTDSDHLSIVVTDLFESNSDWSNVAKKIKEKYFAQHLAVAIVGIKNPFNGDIFDVGLDNMKFNYNSGADSNKYRPFYMMILGHENDVKEFLQRWKDKNAASNETQYLLLSENLMDQVPTLATMEIVDSKNVFADEKLNIADKRMKEFGIDAYGDQAMIMTRFTYKPVIDGCKVDMGKLKTSIQAQVLSDGVWQPTEIDGDLNFQIKEDNERPDDYLLTMSFTPEKTLRKDSINLIHAVVEPSYNGFTLPDWVRNWNMENPAGVTPDQFDGSKTINFMHLVQSLKESALDAAKPSLANITLVVSK
jgi:hypothetical protein